MNLQPIFTILLACLTGTTLANLFPYLQWCTPQGYKWNQDIGFVLQVKCPNQKADEQCEQMNIAPCFANYYGQLTPAANSMGNFNNSCTNCTLGLTKDDNSTVGYGVLDCQCVSGFSNETLYNHASIQTSLAISWDNSTGLISCPYNDGQSLDQSASCQPMQGMVQSPDSSRGLYVRRRLREPRKWGDE